MTWGYTFRDEIKNGFADAGAARTALADAVARQAASEQATAAEVDAQSRAEKNPIFTATSDTGSKNTPAGPRRPKRSSAMVTSPGI